MSIRYETDDAMGMREAGEERGATALDPEAVERAQPRHRKSNSGIPVDSSHLSSSQVTRRSSSMTTDPSARRSSSMQTDPMATHHGIPAPMEPMGGITRPYQRPRGKRPRPSELDPGPTQTFGPADPLPPSPAAREQTEGWFRPSLLTESIPDLSALAGDTNRTYDPHMHHSLPGLAFHEEVESVPPPPVRRSLIDLQSRPWLFSALLAATCLSVGMVLGALLFGAHSDGDAPSERDQVVVRCSDPPAR